MLIWQPFAEEYFRLTMTSRDSPVLARATRTVPGTCHCWVMLLSRVPPCAGYLGPPLSRTGVPHRILRLQCTCLSPGPRLCASCSSFKSCVCWLRSLLRSPSPSESPYALCSALCLLLSCLSMLSALSRYCHCAFLAFHENTRLPETLCSHSSCSLAGRSSRSSAA